MSKLLRIGGNPNNIKDWENCNIPSGCKRHLHPADINNAKLKSTLEAVTAEIETPKGQGGLDYENMTLSVIEKFIQTNTTKLSIANNNTAGFSAHGADLELSLNGAEFNVEVKKDLGAQMGGGILDYESGIFIPKGKLQTETDPLILEEILKLAQSKQGPLEAYINYIASNDSTYNEYNSKKGIPVKTTVSVRDQAKKAGLMVPINGVVKTTTDFMVTHYNSKNTFYIQIGKAGLFYLGSNPLDLPVPALNANINVEFRLGYSGTKSGTNNAYRSANLRAQARIKDRIKSPYSLDDIKSLKKLFKK